MDEQLIASELRTLDDIVTPPPVSYLPQTWGWAALALLCLLVAGLLAWRYYRRRRANRYRRAALAEIDRMERQLRLRATNFAIEAALPPLLKRTALAAWPRSDVASLSGGAWTQFLADHAPGGRLDEPVASFVRDREYRPAAARQADDLRLLRAARAWIEGHHV
jgi:hypothetical protein